MRAAIAGAAAMTLAAAAAAALALHSPPSKSSQRAPEPAVDASAVAASTSPTEAVPGMVWRSGSVTLRLTDRPCPSEDLSRALEAEGVSQPRAYEVTQGRRHYTGCWAKDLGGDVVTMEPGRDVGSIPVAWFEPAR